MKGIPRILFVIVLLLTIVLSLSRCLKTADNLPKDIRGEEYTGAQTCAKCHQDLSVSYAHSPHGLTSAPVVDQKLQQVFHPDSNRFIFNKHSQVIIEKGKGGFFQTAYQDGKMVRTEKFDIVFGSGEKAFTYGYWQGKKLFELPLSYFSAIQNWSISPGFPSEKFFYDRGITSRCIECHGSYVEKKLEQKSAFTTDEEMERGSIIYGIDCERCHGPGKAHVVFHIENPTVKTPKFMVVYDTLNRKQKMDACAVCHSGNSLMSHKSVFSFKPGDNLDDYYVQDFIGFGGGDPDVHGNQSTMLQSSACYRESRTMTCQSCHQTHENLKGNLSAYSQKCISCHQSVAHSKTTLAKGILSTDCINCHMPKIASKLISFQQAGKKGQSAYPLRSHRVAIYNDLKSLK